MFQVLKDATDTTGRKIVLLACGLFAVYVIAFPWISRPTLDGLNFIQDTWLYLMLAVIGAYENLHPKDSTLVTPQEREQSARTIRAMKILGAWSMIVFAAWFAITLVLFLHSTEKAEPFASQTTALGMLCFTLFGVAYHNPYRKPNTGNVRDLSEIVAADLRASPHLSAPPPQSAGERLRELFRGPNLRRDGLGPSVSRTVVVFLQETGIAILLYRAFSQAPEAGRFVIAGFMAALFFLSAVIPSTWAIGLVVFGLAWAWFLMGSFLGFAAFLAMLVFLSKGVRRAFWKWVWVPLQRRSGFWGHSGILGTLLREDDYAIHEWRTQAPEGKRAQTLIREETDRRDRWLLHVERVPPFMVVLFPAAGVPLVKVLIGFWIFNLLYNFCIRPIHRALMVRRESMALDFAAHLLVERGKRRARAILSPPPGELPGNLLGFSMSGDFDPWYWLTLPGLLVALTLLVLTASLFVTLPIHSTDFLVLSATSFGTLLLISVAFGYHFTEAWKYERAQVERKFTLVWDELVPSI